MTKTPEEMAEEYCNQDKVACDAINHAAEHLVKAGFLAGYQAAKNQVADASKVMCKTEKWKDPQFKLRVVGRCQNCLQEIYGDQYGDGSHVCKVTLGAPPKEEE